MVIHFFLPGHNRWQATKFQGKKLMILWYPLTSVVPVSMATRREKKGCHFQKHNKAAIHYVDQCSLFIIYPEKLSRGQIFLINLVKDLIKLFREKWSNSRNFLSRKPLRIKYVCVFTYNSKYFIHNYREITLCL